MKYAIVLLIGYVAFASSMEQPDDPLLSAYISPLRAEALSAIRTEFKISHTRWAHFATILKRLHDITQPYINVTEKDVATWKQIQEHQCANALLHKMISKEEQDLYLAVIHAFVRRKMTPPSLKLELFSKKGRSMQTTEEVVYETSIPMQSQLDKLLANLSHLERHVTIQINQQELERFSSPFIALAAEHEIGHYYHIDCITSSLLRDLIREQQVDDTQIFHSSSWIALDKLMEKEADDFMINGDPKRVGLAQKYIINPGHWNFNLEVLLFAACDTNKEDIVAQLINDGVMLNAHAATNRDTALHIVAFKGNITIAHMLLVAGANIDAVNNQFETPLHIACLHGHTALVKLFVEKYNANPNAKKIGNITPLMLAAHRGKIESIDILLKAGANRNDRASNNARAHQFAHDNSQHEAANRLKAEMGISEWWHRIWD